MAWVSTVVYFSAAFGYCVLQPEDYLTFHRYFVSAHLATLTFILVGLVLQIATECLQWCKRVDSKANQVVAEKDSAYAALLSFDQMASAGQHP